MGLFRSQAALLIHLSERDGQTHTEIAEQLRISPAAASKVINRMETLNYLHRRPDPLDKRIWRVHLKDEGRAMLAQIRPVFQKLNAIIATDFSPDELALLREMLIRIHANLQDHPECQNH